MRKKAAPLTAYPQPSVTVDVVLLGVRAGALQVVTVRRDEAPYKGHAALPGTFVRIDETLEAAVRRVLRDKAHVTGVFAEQLYTFGELKRDPRGRVLTIAYVALVDDHKLAEAARGKGVALGKVVVPWAGETGGPIELEDARGTTVPLAFDHADLVGMAVKRLRGKLDYTPIGFQLLPPEFTLRQLQDVHETVLGRDINKDSFRRRMLASGQLEATGARQEDVEHRPAELYRFGRRSVL